MDRFTNEFVIGMDGIYVRKINYNTIIQYSVGNEGKYGIVLL